MPESFKYVTSCLWCTSSNVSTDFNSMITLFSTTKSSLYPTSTLMDSYSIGKATCDWTFKPALLISNARAASYADSSKPGPSVLNTLKIQPRTVYEISFSTTKQIKMKKPFACLLGFKPAIIAGLISFASSSLYAQIPVEVFGGDKKTTLDILFFKYFKNKRDENSKFLFFNRNRASIDYRQTSTANLPAFGFTEAVSYNHGKLKGFAPVAVVQIFNNGVFPKAGVQYFHRKSDFTFFSWVVIELVHNPTIDFFVLTRFEPKLTDKLHLFTQLELVNAFPTEVNANYNFIQRSRLGLKIKDWQFGFGSDFNEFGTTTFTNTSNIGAFLRHEFN